LAGAGLVLRDFEKRDISDPFAPHVLALRQKKKPFARRIAAKGLGRGAVYMPYPVRRVPHVGHRVDGFTGP